MLYYRRKILLATLEVFGGKLTAKQLQKLLFLFSRGQEIKAYDFVPYYYGCFSFQANQDIVILGNQGLLTIKETEHGRFIELVKSCNYLATLDLFDQQAMLKLKSKYEKMSQTDLIKYTYVKFPFYAINSRIASDILSKEEIEIVNNQRRHIEGMKLFTIGYEGITLETYLKRLIINDIHLLCDVRRNAYSQKYGFSKTQLEKACAGLNIAYIHIPELGIESQKRQDLKSQKDYDILFDEYEKTTLKNNQESLLKIRTLLDRYKRIALTCFEKNPMQCHRSRVAKALLSLSNNLEFKAI